MIGSPPPCTWGMVDPLMTACRPPPWAHDRPAPGIAEAVHLVFLLSLRSAPTWSGACVQRPALWRQENAEAAVGARCRFRIVVFGNVRTAGSSPGARPSDEQPNFKVRCLFSSDLFQQVAAIVVHPACSSNRWSSAGPVASPAPCSGPHCKAFPSGLQDHSLPSPAAGYGGEEDALMSRQHV